MAITNASFTIDGQSYELEYNENTGKWEGLITAPPTSYHQEGGYYPCKIEATNDRGITAQATASHNTVGEKLKVVVREDEAPSVTIMRPLGSEKLITSEPQIIFLFSDEVGGSGLDLGSVEVRAGEEVFTDIEIRDLGQQHKGLFTFPHLPNGDYDLFAAISDNDGNVGWAKVEVSIFNYSTVAKTDWTNLDYYNYWDLNRVEFAVWYLNEILVTLGYGKRLSFRKPWALNEIPTRADMERYLGNVYSLREKYLVLETTPELPESIRYLDSEGANAIEQNLLDMYLLVGMMIKRRLYSGEHYLNEITS